VGDDDEVGALNYLDAEQVLRGSSEIRSGKTFTLQVQIGHPQGDPAYPGPRTPASRVNRMDRGCYLNGTGLSFPGGLELADDKITMYLHSRDLGRVVSEDGDPKLGYRHHRQ
jgi:hypothetical protein